MSGETSGLAKDENLQYFLSDKYRLQKYLANSAIITIDNKTVGSRTASDNVAWTFDSNIHLERKRKRKR